MSRVEPWNTFVEGDNLEVVPRLAPAYGPFDVVYLDPPYNTGNPFVYGDKVAGRRADRHRAWATMMRPRLEAVRDVMTERGAVFVSIDDNEVARLRLLMDEVFGEDCFVAQIVVNLNPKGRQLGWRFRDLARVPAGVRAVACPTARSTRRARPWSTRATSR